jgi:hypothetical protein
MQDRWLNLSLLEPTLGEWPQGLLIVPSVTLSYRDLVIPGNEACIATRRRALRVITSRGEIYLLAILTNYEHMLIISFREEIPNGKAEKLQTGGFHA